MGSGTEKVSSNAPSDPSGDGRPDSWQRKNREILDAATRVFERKGYAAASIQEIADEVGILKGSLYHYIKTKEDLLFGVIRGVHEAGFGLIEEVDSGDGGPVEKLEAFIYRYVAHSIENRVVTQIFFHDFRFLSEERRESVLEQRDVYDKFVRRLISEGKEQGVIDPSIDVKVISMALFGMINWTYQWYRPDGGASPEHIAEQIAEFTLRGIRPADRR